ncbi:GrpB family protein [Cryptosporangium arvum]|uniref:GrpB family protein n=1 Tax=Cryptosporangium arvum TaxID=80871 RepID=UPI0004B11759|nr:GrpB family protein [Cryptosporangium arvum]
MDGRTDQAGKRVIHIADYDPSWPARFAEIGAALRRALGDVALRIDHIGSTSVPGLAAKAIIDVQISVIRLEPVEPFRDRLRGMGLVYRADNPERTKRYFREAPGRPRSHIHVRRAGSFSEQFSLLFRDFLRVDRRAAADYVSVKRDLARRHPHDGQAYTDAKAAICWAIIHRADEWAQQNGWEPGPSDA